MRELHPEQTPLPVRHFFAPGVYCRELFIPAGMRLTGAIHLTEHVSIMLSGKMQVLKDGEFVEINGPMTEIAQPGIKRMGKCIEDTTWITVHATDETDVEKLEAMLVTNDWADVEHLLDQQDYVEFENERGITDEIKEQLKQIPYCDVKCPTVKLGDSNRHGIGVFAVIDISAGEKVAPVDKGTQWSRFTNHSIRPNSKLVGDVFIAVKDINKGEEITVNYRHVSKVLT